MEAGIRADLNSSRLSTVPKRDTQRAVLQFVNGLRSFSRVHATEGRAYMSSWKAKESIVNSTPTKARNPQSCGFATPILKPRVVVRKQVIQGLKSSEPPTTFSNRVKTKPGGSIPSKEDLPPRRRHRVKRNRELQSDEEKRLYERREKKRARREIMRPAASKKQTEDRDQPQKKPKSKRMPAGLALMYGFTATNVGKSRLTVKPSLRSGMFGKGKASIQTQANHSKLKDKSLVFSEEEFLKSATAAGKCRHREPAPSGSQSSYTSSEGTDGLQSARTNSMAPLAQKRRKAKILQNDATKDEAKSSPRSKNAQSVIWDIEKEDGVLPAESSSVLTRGSKTNTVLLNIQQERWLPEYTRERGVTDAQVQESSVQQKNTVDDDDTFQHSVAEQETPSSISSVSPSKSPSQVVYAQNPGVQPGKDIISKYFNRTSSVGDTTQKPHVNLAVSGVLPNEGKQAGSIDLDYKSHTGGNCNRLEGEEIHRNVKFHLKDVGIGSDWLLSDPVLSPTSNRDRDRGAELFLLDELEDIQSDLDFENVFPREPDGLNREEEIYLAGDPELDPPQDPLSMFEADLCGQHPVEGVNYEGYEYDYPICHSDIHVENVEEAYSQPIPLREWDCHTFGECDDGSSILLDHTSPSSIGSSKPILSSVGNDFDDLAAGPLLRFNEGRCLLLGASGLCESKDLSTIESDVARRLTRHWVPQRY